MTAAKVHALAKKLNCTIDRGERQINVDAPKGKVFKSQGTHTLVSGWNRGFIADYQDLYDRMLPGLDDCDEPNCDICQEND